MQKQLSVIILGSESVCSCELDDAFLDIKEIVPLEFTQNR